MGYLLNITRIRTVAQALAALEQKVVFVGGAAVCLYTNPEIALEVLPMKNFLIHTSMYLLLLQYQVSQL